jgi:hypothetical protein
MRCEMDALVRCLFWIVLIHYARQDTSLRRLMDCAALCVVAIVLALVLIVCIDSTAAQEGYMGHNHDKWHQGFYSTLNRPDGKGSCCNLRDCRPSSIRSSNGRYDIKKDGRWIPVPMEKVIKRTAPDGGAHICAPPSNNNVYPADEIFCVIMPPET